MRRYTFYLSVALLAFGVGLLVVYFNFLKTENISNNIVIEVKDDAQINTNQENSNFSIENIGRLKEKFTCNDKTLLLVWDELRKDFDKDWTEHLIAFDVDDCAKAYKVEKVIDLNNDGQLEIIVRGNNLADCTVTGNCSFAVFEKEGERFKFILEGNEIQQFKVEKTRTNGYYDLHLRTHNTAFSSYHQIFKFSGENYEYQKCWWEDYEAKDKKGNWYEVKKPVIHYAKCGEYEYAN